MRRFLKIVVVLMVAIAIMVSCKPPTGPEPEPEPGDRELAEDYFDAGVLAIIDSDYGVAYTMFQASFNADNTFYPAVLAYSLMELASLWVSPAVVTYAQDVLGIVDDPTDDGYGLDYQDNDYPEDMTELYNGSWLVDIYPDDVEDDSMFFDVEGQRDFDGYWSGEGDGDIDPLERIAALVTNLINNSVNPDEVLNDIIDLVAGNLDTILDNVSARLAAVPDSATISFDYEMLHIDAEDWPVMDEDGITPLPIVIGKAEVNVVHAALEIMQSFANSSRAISMAFPVDDYWGAFDPETGEFDYPAATPFSLGLLGLRSGYAALLGDAGDQMADAMERIEAACTVFAGRSNSGFTLDATSPFWGDGGPTWGEMVTSFNFVRLATGKMADSINTSTPFVFPVDAYNYEGPLEFYAAYDTEGEWPVAADIQYDSGTNEWTIVAASANLGAIYGTESGPIAFILELDGAGEPEFYTFDDGTDTFTQFEKGVDIYSEDEIYYIKVPDITFGGAVPPATFPDLTEVNITLNTGPNPFDTDEDYLTDNPFVWIQQVGDIIEAYVVDMPMSAGHSLVPTGSTFDLPDPATAIIPTTSLGSYWWGLAEFLSNGAPVTISRFTGYTNEAGGTGTGDAAALTIDNWNEDSIVFGENLWYTITGLSDANTYLLFGNTPEVGNEQYSADIYLYIYEDDGLTEIVQDDPDFMMGTEFSPGTGQTQVFIVAYGNSGGDFAIGVQQAP